MSKQFIPPHGGYKDLLSFQKAEIVYDATVRFCADLLDRRDRTVDQMVQAARAVACCANRHGNANRCPVGGIHPGMIGNGEYQRNGWRAPGCVVPAQAGTQCLCRSRTHR